MDNRSINQARRAVRNNQALLLQIDKLQKLVKEQTRKIASQQNELQIKSDAIQQQTQDIKKLDAELVWTRAALAQSQEENQKRTEQTDEDASWQGKYIRLQAETDNLRKRWEQRSVEKTREERNQILMDMLPLADHLEMALKHSGKVQTDNSSAEPKNDPFVENIQATYSAFISTLKRYNVEPIDAQDQPFDPMLHEAVGQTDYGDGPTDHVAQVVQTGYKDGDRLLRPARVLVRSS